MKCSAPKPWPKSLGKLLKYNLNDNNLEEYKVDLYWRCLCSRGQYWTLLIQHYIVWLTVKKQTSSCNIEGQQESVLWMEMIVIKSISSASSLDKNCTLFAVPEITWTISISFCGNISVLLLEVLQTSQVV